MAYSNTSNASQRDIKYLNKDFGTLKNQLIEYLTSSVEWRRALSEKFGERPLS